MTEPREAPGHLDVAGYLLDALECEEKDEADAHLALCGGCREEVVALRRTEVSLRGIPVELLLSGPDHDAERLIQRTVRVARNERRRHRALGAASRAASDRAASEPLPANPSARLPADPSAGPAPPTDRVIPPAVPWSPYPSAGPAERFSHPAPSRPRTGPRDPPARRAARSRIPVLLGCLILLSTVGIGLVARTLLTHSVGETGEHPSRVAGDLALTRVLAGHTDGADGAAFNRTGTLLATASRDGTVGLWDPATGALSRPRLDVGDVAVDVAFSRSGQLAVSTAGGLVRRWDPNTGSFLEPALTGHTGAVLAVAYSPDGTRIIGGGDDGTVRMWDARTGRQIGAPWVGHTGGVTSLAFSPDGSRVATSSYDGTIRLWDPTTGRQVGPSLAGHTGAVITLAFSPDGTRLASAGADATVRLWETATGKEVGRPLLGHAGTVFAVAYSTDGGLIASGGADGTIRLWSAGTGAPLGSPHREQGGTIYAVVFSPDGSTLASTSDRGVAALWAVS